VWGGDVPSPPGEGAGRGHSPSQKKILILALNMVSFGAFMDDIFLQFSYLFYTQNRCNLVPLPIYFFLIFRFKKDLVHFLAFWRHMQKFHAAGPVLVRPSECITLHLGL